MSNFAQLSEGDGTIFLVRWRGRQEGPYAGSVIEAKLASNEIGLLHEIYYEGKWITIRDHILEREAILNAELKVREKAEQALRAQEEKKARERDELHRAETLAEERRKNDLLAAGLVRQTNVSQAPGTPRIALNPHRGGQILALGLIGAFVCGPLCVAAWIMGSGDLHEMDAGLMDDSGRSNTNTGKNLGIIGTLLWIIGVAGFLLAH